MKGAETLSRRHQLVLVNDTAEAITAQNASMLAWRFCGNWWSRLRWRERQRTMGPVTVVVIDERRNDPLKVWLVQNQQPVETLGTGRAHEPLGNAVRLWRAKRRSDDLNSLRSKHFVECVGEFLIPITNQKPDRRCALG